MLSASVTAPLKMPDCASLEQVYPVGTKETQEMSVCPLAIASRANPQ